MGNTAKHILENGLVKSDIEAVNIKYNKNNKNNKLKALSLPALIIKKILKQKMKKFYKI